MAMLVGQPLGVRCWWYCGILWYGHLDGNWNSTDGTKFKIDQAHGTFIGLCISLNHEEMRKVANKVFGVDNDQL